jgi:hypothetical protein
MRQDLWAIAFFFQILRVCKTRYPRSQRQIILFPSSFYRIVRHCLCRHFIPFSYVLTKTAIPVLFLIFLPLQHQNIIQSLVLVFSLFPNRVQERSWLHSESNNMFTARFNLTSPTIRDVMEDKATNYDFAELLKSFDDRGTLWLAQYHRQYSCLRWKSMSRILLWKHLSLLSRSRCLSWRNFH